MNLPNLSAEAICHILGAKFPVPLTPQTMARSLRVAFYPAAFCSRKLETFLERLKLSLINSGVKVVSYEDALAEGDNGRIGKGIVLIEAGAGAADNICVDRWVAL